MKVRFAGPQGKNGFLVVSEKGSYIFRNGSKDEEVPELALWIVNTLNTAIAREAREERKAKEKS